MIHSLSHLRYPGSKNAFVARKSLHDYSQLLEHEVLPRAISRRAESTDPLVLATSTIPFTELYAEIRTRAIGDSAANAEVFRLFENRLASGTWPADDEGPVQSLKPIFERFAKANFPHFAALHAYGDRVQRLCLFAGTNISSQDDLVLHILNTPMARAALYAFLNWLIRDTYCRFAVFSQSGESLGLRESRDFAVFNDEVLIEYHPASLLYIQVERGPRSWEDVWNFCEVSRFRQGSPWENVAGVIAPDDLVSLLQVNPAALEIRIAYATLEDAARIAQQAKQEFAVQVILQLRTFVSDRAATVTALVQEGRSGAFDPQWCARARSTVKQWMLSRA